MKKIYFLKTCDTCKKILKSIPLDGFTLQEIKTDKITLNQLEEMKILSGSYESLFSKRAKKYQAMDLKNESLTEKDFKQLILDEYTFLKRPVIIINDHIFIGNSKNNIESLLQFIEK
ncbi:MAG: arsenate reductase [Flavobacteriaceae bacterium]|nr:arsenate reductase [Flavobacteriaceae bacterium]